MPGWFRNFPAFGKCRDDFQVRVTTDQTFIDVAEKSEGKCLIENIRIK